MNEINIIDIQKYEMDAENKISSPNRFKIHIILIF